MEFARLIDFWQTQNRRRIEFYIFYQCELEILGYFCCLIVLKAMCAAVVLLSIRVVPFEYILTDTFSFICFFDESQNSFVVYFWPEFYNIMLALKMLSLGLSIWFVIYLLVRMLILWHKYWTILTNNCDIKMSVSDRHTGL